MTQELLDLRQCILERRYDDALALVDELEDMSKQAILRNIESFLMRLMVHLIKNQACCDRNLPDKSTRRPRLV